MINIPFVIGINDHIHNSLHIFHLMNAHAYFI